VRHSTRDNDDRCDLINDGPAGAGVLDFRCKVRSEEPTRHHGLIDSPEAIQSDRPKASTHRVTHQERSGQCGGTHRNSNYDSQIRSLVVLQALSMKGENAHGGSLPYWLR